MRQLTHAGRQSHWLLAGLVAAGAAVAAEPVALLAEFGRGHALIVTRRQCLFLDVYLPEGEAQRAQGLMHIRELGEFEGMLFASPEPAFVNMWMRNTYIPLDMIFVAEGDRVVGIVAQTATLSDDIIRSPGPVTGVLEVNGGFSARHRVAPGDTVRLLPTQ